MVVFNTNQFHKSFIQTKLLIKPSTLKHNNSPPPSPTSAEQIQTIKSNKHNNSFEISIDKLYEPLSKYKNGITGGDECMST